MPEDTPQSYWARLATWGQYALVVLALTAVNALMARWLGSAPQLQPPPAPVVVVSPEGVPLSVQVIRPE